MKAQTIVANLKEYGEKQEAEKAYLHYDKSAYTAGETIWFKAYIMQGDFPAEITKTFYLDWLDEKGNVLFHSVCPVYNSSAAGQFDIPLDYKGNNIHVRGYTRWMLNFDTAFLYNKDIRIISIQTSTAKIQKPIPSIRFFPEGGDIIKGTINKIAFKVNDQWGRPIKVNGKIETDKGVVVGSFKSIHDGMGYFNLFPDADEKYIVKWNDEKGENYTTNLPVNAMNGIQLSVGVKDDKTYLTLSRSEEINNNMKEGFVLGTMNQQIVFRTDFNLIQSKSSVKNIPVSQFSNGILTITVFDKNEIPVSERIIFINNQNYSFTPMVNVKKRSLQKRAFNEIEIDIPDSLFANLSMTITDAAFGKDSSENIFSSLLLTSDLKGTVYNPAYYFSSRNNTVKEHLDLVMLTHGWRRFNWDNLRKENGLLHDFQKDSQYLSLSGSLTVDHYRNLNEENFAMLIRKTDSSSVIVNITINQAGHFSVPDFVFFNTVNVFYQLNKSSVYRNAEIDFMKDRMPALVNNKKNKQKQYTSFIDDPYRSQYKLALENWQSYDFFRGKVLENVSIRANAKSPIEILEEKYTHGIFKTNNERSFDLINNPPRYKYQELNTFLRQQVSALWLNNPFYYIDEVLIDKEVLNSFYVSDVAYIKSFRAPFFGNTIETDQGRGAIAIYLRDDINDSNAQGKKMGRKNIAGYTEIREFYSPDYSMAEQKEGLNDLRTTLLWEPMILTEPGNSKKLISFYNNDVSKSYRIIIEGITKDGKLAHFKKIID